MICSLYYSLLFPTVLTWDIPLLCNGFLSFPDFLKSYSIIYMHVCHRIIFFLIIGKKEGMKQTSSDRDNFISRQET